MYNIMLCVACIYVCVRMSVSSALWAEIHVCVCVSTCVSSVQGWTEACPLVRVLPLRGQDVAPCLNKA